jgi:outer membrane biosynthesis protein TonB
MKPYHSLFLTIFLQTPTVEPTAAPSQSPSELIVPVTVGNTDAPTLELTARPTERRKTPQPSKSPTGRPTKTPTLPPSSKPTKSPTAKPTLKPTEAPTKKPTVKPTKKPTAQPTAAPTKKSTSDCPDFTGTHCYAYAMQYCSLIDSGTSTNSPQACIMPDNIGRDGRMLQSSAETLYATDEEIAKIFQSDEISLDWLLSEKLRHEMILRELEM